jgi:hypothetical protein
VKLIALFLLLASASANSPLPKVGDEERKAHIDLDTIQRMVFYRCKATDNPNKALCLVEVTYVGITYSDKPQTTKLPKKAIELEQESGKAHKSTR